MRLAKSDSDSENMAAVSAFIEELEFRALPLAYAARYRESFYRQTELKVMTSSIASLFHRASHYAESPAIRERQLALIAESIGTMALDLLMIVKELKSCGEPGSVEAALGLLIWEISRSTPQDFLASFDPDLETEWLTNLLGVEDELVSQQVARAITLIIKSGRGSCRRFATRLERFPIRLGICLGKVDPFIVKWGRKL